MGGTTEKGFTLLELMMALAVIGVLAAFTIPSFNEFRMNSRMTGTANDLLAALNFARSEAIKRQRPVAFCGSAAPNATPPACDGALSGWVVWADDNNDGAIAANEQVITIHAPIPATLNATTNFNIISYAATGFVQNFGAATRGILLCDERQDAAPDGQLRKRIVTLSPTGRPSVVRTASALGELPTPEPPIDSNWLCP
jgi:type IV fimbrial biogenesis protein FimT